MGDPTSSYATAGIALRVSGALKPHHHDKVETPSVGFYRPYTGELDQQLRGQSLLVGCRVQYLQVVCMILLFWTFRLGRFKRWWGNIIQMGLKEIRCEDMYWIQLSEDGAWWIRQWTFVSHKWRRLSWPAERLSSSKRRRCSVVFVNIFMQWWVLFSWTEIHVRTSQFSK
jgi:hypothetical protein